MHVPSRRPDFSAHSSSQPLCSSSLSLTAHAQSGTLQNSRPVEARRHRRMGLPAGRLRCPSRLHHARRSRGRRRHHQRQTARHHQRPARHPRRGARSRWQGGLHLRWRRQRGRRLRSYELLHRRHHSRRHQPRLPSSTSPPPKPCGPSTDAARTSRSSTPHRARSSPPSTCPASPSSPQPTARATSTTILKTRAKSSRSTRVRTRLPRPGPPAANRPPASPSTSPATAFSRSATATR